MSNGFNPMHGNIIATLQRAMTLHQQGQRDSAEELYRKVLAENPRQFEALHFLGLLHAERGQLVEADHLIAESLTVNTQRPEAFSNHARVLNNLKRPHDALAACDKALAMNPRMTETLVNRGNALQALGRHEEAVESHTRALAIQPNYATAMLNRGTSLSSMGRHADALEDFDRVLATDRANDIALAGRGNALQALDRLEEALTCYQIALVIKPGNGALCRNLGIALHVLERSSEAIAQLTKALLIDPNDDETKANLSLIHLGLGQFKEGWALHDSRFGADKTANRRDYPHPRWDGQTVPGTLLVWGEQGLGDQILYASMIPEAARRADAVVLEVEPRLVALFRRSFPNVQVEPIGERLYDGVVQAQTPIGSLPHFLRPDWDSFLNARRAYLVADESRAEGLRRRLAGDGRRVIGLSWKSANPRYEKAKSAQLTDFAAVLKLPNYRFVDLQYGDTAPDRAAADRALGVRVEHLDDIDNANDIDGLAALMMACDLVVTVSNTTAHLAGALGRPVMLLVPYGHARLWYWFKDRDDSPWYPRVQVRRQLRGQSWADLVAAHAGDVERLTAAT